MSFMSMLRPPVRRSVPLLIVLAVLALVAAVGNAAATPGFPVTSGFERLCNVGITVDLIAMVLALVGCAIFAARQPRAQTRSTPITPSTTSETGEPLPVLDAPRGSALAAIGLAFNGIVWVFWLIFAGSGLIFAAISGATADYLSLVGPVFFLGVLWVLGTVLSGVGFQVGGSGRNRALAIPGVILGVLMMVVMVAAALLFATGHIS